jgi:hypothetical protein
MEDISQYLNLFKSHNWYVKNEFDISENELEIFNEQLLNFLYTDGVIKSITPSETLDIPDIKNQKKLEIIFE